MRDTLTDPNEVLQNLAVFFHVEQGVTRWRWGDPYQRVMGQNFQVLTFPSFHGSAHWELFENCRNRRAHLQDALHSDEAASAMAPRGGWPEVVAPDICSTEDDMAETLTVG